MQRRRDIELDECKVIDAVPKTRKSSRCGSRTECLMQAPCLLQKHCAMNVVLREVSSATAVV